ncbi:hypothetical protein NZ042_00695 [Bacillus sp. FSL K6-1234]|uniref:hypothetical protein n=1 Tax=Bacillus sp. FSL K6-1234 TaxID=2976832 RepID=UPI0030FBFF49
MQSERKKYWEYRVYRKEFCDYCEHEHVDEYIVTESLNDAIDAFLRDQENILQAKGRVSGTFELHRLPTGGIGLLRQDNDSEKLNTRIYNITRQVEAKLILKKINDALPIGERFGSEKITPKNWSNIEGHIGELKSLFLNG